MDEQIYYESEAVKVTNARVVVPSQTYALSGITSVQFAQINPKRIWPVLALAVGLGLAASNPSANVWTYAMFAIPGLLWFAIQKTIYTMKIHSASGESRALESKNKSFVQSVVQAVNQAIIDRAR